MRSINEESLNMDEIADKLDELEFQNIRTEVVVMEFKHTSVLLDETLKI